MTKQKENWFIKNIFSIISLTVLIGGMIAGYAKLQITVDNLKLKGTNKEVIRQVTKEVLVDKLAPIQKDIQYNQKEIQRNSKNITTLYKFSSRKKIGLMTTKTK